MKKRVLGTVLVVAAAFAALLIWVSSHRFELVVSAQVLPVGFSTPDEDIRQRLLSLTPEGSDATNVLKFVVDDLRPKFGASAHVTYVDSLQSGRPERLNVVRLDLRDVTGGFHPPARTIDVTIGRFQSNMRLHFLTARWIFDDNDKLVDIVVGRHGLYP